MTTKVHRQVRQFILFIFIWAHFDGRWCMSVTALQILLAKIQLLCVLVDCLLPLKLDHLSIMVSTTVFAACPRGKGALPFWLVFKRRVLERGCGQRLKERHSF